MRVGASAAGRPGRVGLLLGLVMLIVAHLSGTGHGASFTGPHVSAAVEVFSHHDHHDHHEDADDGTLAPSLGHDHPGHDHPGHDHKGDGHDHAADRPRAAVDDTVAEAEQDGLSPILPAAPGSSAGPAAWHRPPGVARSRDGPSTLALHCVWRQ